MLELLGIEEPVFAPVLLAWAQLTCCCRDGVLELRNTPKQLGMSVPLPAPEGPVTTMTGAELIAENLLPRPLDVRM